MKKFGKILMSLIFSIFFLFCVNLNFSATVTKSANADTEMITHANYYTSYNLDFPLFRALLSLENEVNYENDTEFSLSFFSTGYASASPTSDDGIAIKNDLALNKLNLTIGENSPYECLRNQEEKITDINGLDSLDLSEIQTLILDDNEISSISSNKLSTLTNISVLSVCNNSLSSFVINSSLNGEITQLYLRDNLLKNLDLSGVALNAIIDLAGNLFESLSDITFSGAITSLDLSFNNITEVPSIPLSLGCEPIFLMQGLNKETFKAGDKIAVANNNAYVQGLVVHIKYFAGDDDISASEYYVDSNDILSSAGTIGFNQIELPAGKLEISFSIVTNVNIPEENQKYFENVFIASKIPAPKVIATSNGNEIINYSQNSPMNFYFSLNLSSNVVNNSQITENAVIYSGVFGSEELNRNTFSITEYSLKTLSSYYVFDGIIGEKTTISVSYTKATNTTLGLILIIIMFIVISSVLYVIKWIRNGTPMEPLSEAEIYRERGRQRKRGRIDSPFADNNFNNVGDDVVDLSAQDFPTDEGNTVELIGEDKYFENSEKGRYKK